MRPFDLLQPTALEEAVQLSANLGDEAMFLGGGAMLSVLLRERLIAPRYLISLLNVPELGHSVKNDTGLEFGGATTLRALERSPDVHTSAPLLAEAAHLIGNVRVRNVATVGGHLAQADPHLDLPPVLLVLGASVKVQSSATSRTIPIDEFFTGYYESALGPGEMITALSVRAQPQSMHGVYVRYCSLSQEDWPTLGVAVLLGMNDGRVEDVRIAVGGVADRAFRLSEAEDALRGGAPTRLAIAEVARRYALAADPIADARGSADYKRRLTEVYVRRALEAATGRAGVTIG